MTRSFGAALMLGSLKFIYTLTGLLLFRKIIQTGNKRINILLHCTHLLSRTIILHPYDNMPASNPIALKNKFVLSILLLAISGGEFLDAITLSKTRSLKTELVPLEQRG